MKIPHALAGFLALVILSQYGSVVAQQGLGGAAPPLPAALLQCEDLAAALRTVADQDTRLRDWANLARYREANRTQARPDVVFMGDVANPTTVPQTTRRPVARIRALNDWMKAYATSNKHTYLDYYSAMVDGTGMLKAELSSDDLHPNAAGYAVMAPLAEAAIELALR